MRKAPRVPRLPGGAAPSRLDEPAVNLGRGDSRPTCHQGIHTRLAAKNHALIDLGPTGQLVLTAAVLAGRAFKV